MTTNPEVRSGAARSLAPLALDVALPIALYFGARQVLGASVVDAYLISSIAPVASTLLEFARQRRVNAVALLMLVINLAGIGLTFVTGSIRIGTAKSAAVSGVVALFFVVSALRDRPVLTPGVRAYIARGDAARERAWDHLTATSVRFGALGRRFTLIMGLALLTECAARLVTAALAPADVLGWLPTVLLAAGVTAGVIVSGGAAADPMTTMIDAAAAAQTCGRSDCVAATA